MAIFRHTSILPHPQADVFAWHNRPGALIRLTPPGTATEVSRTTPNGATSPLAVGTTIKLRLGSPLMPLPKGISPHLTAIHTELQPPQLFVDEQLSGPMRYWRHEHRMLPVNARSTETGGAETAGAERIAGTKMQDTVTFSMHPSTPDTPLPAGAPDPAPASALEGGAATASPAAGGATGSAASTSAFSQWRERALALPRHLAEAAAKKELKRLFTYRHQNLADDLDFHARWQDAPRLTVAVSGASGLVGTQLCAVLETGGHTVKRLVRREAESSNEISWDPAAERLDYRELAGVDVVVNLSGASIGQKFTPKNKKLMLTSRVQSSELLARALVQARHEFPDTAPRALVQASAIGIYGPRRPGEVLFEDSATGNGFLAEVCQAWEAAAKPAADAGIRTVFVRTGLVLSGGGGSLLPQLPIFMAGLGGRTTAANAMLSWISLDDMARLYAHAVLDETLTGPVNAVAPEAVNAALFAQTLGTVLKRPTLLPVPEFGPKLILGAEGADQLIHTDQLVSPRLIRDHGFKFAQPNLEQALRHVLRR